MTRGYQIVIQWMIIQVLIKKRLDCGAETCGEPNRFEKIDSSSIDLINRQFHESVDDLSLKVMGGYVSFAREYFTNTWTLARAWQGLEFGYGFTGNVETVYHAGIKYPAANPEATVFVYDADHHIYKTETGYYLQGENGAWREFASNGNLLRSGDRAGALMVMHYDATNDLLIGVSDKFTNQVLWIEHNTNGLITAVKDAASGGRQVQYQYDSTGKITNFVNALSLSTAYSYDGQNRITGIRRADGRFTQITYNQYGYVSSVSRTNGYSRTFDYRYDDYKKEYYSLVQTAGGRITEKRFDASGKLIWSALNGRATYDANETDPDAPVYEYNANGDITKTTYTDGSTVIKEYNGPNGEMTREVNESGVVTLYSYDSQGNLTNKVDASGSACSREIRFAFDAFGNMLSMTVSGSNSSSTSHMSYDNRGNVLTVTDPMGNVTSNSYDNSNNLISVTDPLGHTRSMTYDLAGRPVSATDPAGNIISNSYDLAGNLVLREVHDASANSLQSTVYSYDSENRPIATSNNFGQTTTAQYDSDGNLFQSTDAAGRITVYSYNYDGKLLCQSTPAGDIFNAYDDQGRLASVTDVRGNVTTFEYVDETARVKKVNYPTFTREYTYDARGRPILLTDTVNGVPRSTLYALDSLGRVLSITDPLNRTTQSSYDQLGRRLSVINALGATNGFEYNVFGNLTKLIDAKGNQTTFDYDLNGRLTQKTYADSSAWNYEYDGVGNLVKRTDAKEQITAYSYDLLSRLVTNSYYPSSASYPSSPSKTVSFSYDAFGRMTNWSDGVYSGSFSYDDTNLIRHVTVDYGPWTKSYSYQSDALGRKTGFIGPDNVEITYSYNIEDRLSAINIPGEGTISYSMNQHGQLAGQTLPGGNSRYYGYDAMMSLITNVALDSAQNSLMIRAYSRQLAGNIINQQTESGSISYNYDAIDQLIGVTNVALGNEWYSYDAMGNRLASSNTISGSTNALTYSVNSLNQYLQIENWQSEIENYQYDANGNRTNKVTATETNAYTWDIENRLVGFQKTATNGVTTASYAYDPFGRRLSKAVNGVTNYFLYADEGLIGEYDSSGNEIRSYGYVPNSLWGNNAVWMHTFVPSLNGGETNYLYYLNDHLGAPQQLVRKNGAVAWAAVMDAFGNAHILPGAVVTNNLRFSSQYYDEESGLNYNTHRYFDPVSGRYISRDLLQDMAFFRIYARNKPYAEIRKLLQYLNLKSLFNFADNQPIRRVDVGGLSNEPVGDNIPALPPDWEYIPDTPVSPTLLGPWDQRREHGKYCGPGWTGGSYIAAPDFDWNGHIPWPDDELDSCCMIHDACYAGINLNDPVPRLPVLNIDYKQCDLDIIECAKKTPLSKSKCGIILLFWVREKIKEHPDYLIFQ